MHKPIFGVELEQHLLSSNRQISLVLEVCVALLLSSLNEEGLFRISGSVPKIKLFTSAFNSGRLDALRSVDNCRDVHAIAGTLKSYFRCLPQPLLTVELYNEWLQAAKYVHFYHNFKPNSFFSFNSKKDEAQKLNALQAVLYKMPESYRNNLKYLLKFLNRLSSHSYVNKMSPQNIAIAIGPSLMWSSQNSTE